MARAGNSRRTSLPGQLIDVGGHRLHALILGTGSPTVVFESGGGDTLDVWHLVQPEVAKFTRTCSYDRASVGWSEPGPKPRTSHQIVKELRALLKGAHVEPPYVLVAHSYGGMHANLFTRLFPKEVAGIVLVDTIHEDHYDRIPPIMGQDLHDRTVRAQLRGEEMRVPEDILESINQVRSAGPFPDVPLVVITAGRNDWGSMGGTWAQVQEAWLDMHAQYVSRVTHGRHIVDTKSGHRPHLENPQLVIEAIREVVDKARKLGGSRASMGFSCPGGRN